MSFAWLAEPVRFSTLAPGGRQRFVNGLSGGYMPFMVVEFSSISPVRVP